LDEEYKSFSSSLCNLLHSPVTSSLLGPNILLNATFSNTLSFLSSRNCKDQVSHSYKAIGKITVGLPRGKWREQDTGLPRGKWREQDTGLPRRKWREQGYRPSKRKMERTVSSENG